MKTTAQNIFQQGNKKAASFVVALIVGLSSGYLAGTTYKGPSKVITNVVQSGITEKQVELTTKIRKLFADNVMWTRAYITALAEESGEIKDIHNRLIQNQVDIGNTIGEYYGGNSGTSITNLLKRHVALGIDIIHAAEEGGSGAVASAKQEWNDSAQQIASFLSSRNSNWPKREILDRMTNSIDLTVEGVKSASKKKWFDNITIFDRVLNENMALADILSSGIVKQFPQKFQSE